MTGGLEVAARSRNSAHAPVAQPSIEHLALAPGEPVGGIGAGGLIHSSFGQTDSATAEEGVDSLEPRSPFDIRPVVRDARRRE